MSYSVREIATALGASFDGDGNLKVTGVAEPSKCKKNQIALALEEKYAEGLKDGLAQTAVMWPGADWKSYGLKSAIFAPRPRFALANLSELVDPGQGFESGIHVTAYVHPSAKLGRNVSVGVLSCIGAEAVIGNDTMIGPQVCVGANVQIGAKSYLREGVKIGSRVHIGERFIAQPGAVLGSDGFSFVTRDLSGVEKVRETLGDQEGAAPDQSWRRIHSLGSVRVGDDVEIGANTCIDSGTVRATQIGNSVKIDNLVHIGHNVVVGDNCLICGQVGIAGSVNLGRNVVLAGQTGINDNIKVGDNVIAGGASKIFTNVPTGRVVLGYPAVKMQNHVNSYKAIRRLPRLFKEVAELKKTIFKTDGKK
ncbi:MAG: UDP-3-O-(3-hydroxymyristoyl)glucosamine N-acyltransferase [Rhodobacteraceae bacterium]|nr:UDP-3-O-(3-hydroxymyristoyl)glucosamine N-acyltransferase [Paracoccaceae bacterium]